MVALGVAFSVPLVPSASYGRAALMAVQVLASLGNIGPGLTIIDGIGGTSGQA